MSIIDLPTDIIAEIFTYLVYGCDYVNFNQYNILKLSMPDVSMIYNESLLIRKKTMVLNSHIHFRYRETHVDLCGYVYEPFILEIYDMLLKSVKKKCLNIKKQYQYKNTRKRHEASKTYSTITIHPTCGIPPFYMKHMKHIIYEFCRICNMPFVEFSHLCCSGIGVVCRTRDPNHIT